MTDFDYAPDLPMPTPPEALRDVLVVPWGLNEPRGAKRAAGLFGADGAYLPQGACLRYDADPLTIEPEFDAEEPVGALKGRWLYGGMMYGHFGHFLCESTSRLWPLEDLEVDGILWLPKVKLTHDAKLVKPFRHFFDVLGFPGIGLIATQRPVRVEELVIPAQGFGIGPMAAGKPQYRRFMRERFAAGEAGSAKLYISRSRLPGKRGSVVLEERIEEYLAAEGYRIFHPEGHSVEEQIAVYRSAAKIVALDGSALHLAAMAVDAGCKVAIINRGPSQNIGDYIRQFAHFAGIGVCAIDAVRAYWFDRSRRVVKREVQTLLDLPTVGRALADAGFVARGDWKNVDEGDVATEIALREARYAVELQRYEA